MLVVERISRIVKILFIVSMLAIVLFSQRAFSQDTPVNQASRFSLFGGAALGGTYLVPQTSSEVSKYGFHFLLSGAANVRFEVWDFDVGGGWLYNRLFSSKGEEVRSGAGGMVLEQRDVNIRSRTGIVSLAARREITVNWRLGPALALLLDRSVAFSQHPEAKAARFIGGLSATRDFEFMPAPLFRGTIDLQTDLNIRKRQIFFLTVGFQVGIEPFREFNSPEAVVPAPAPPVSPPAVRVVLDGLAVNFDSAKWVLEPRLEKLVRMIGNYLKEHESAWTALTIEGHTDSRGKIEYNRELSQKRARTIHDLIVGEGVAAGKVSSIGYGPTRLSVLPEVTPDDLRRNRRVVFVFDGVTAPDALNGEIARIRKELGLVGP